MSGTITPFVDFTTTNDTGANNVDSVQPLTDGEVVNQAVLRRPHENIRVRTEALRSLATDSLYLQNADRALILAGPGKIRWDGTLAAYPLATYAGQLVLSDVLWLMPMLAPGYAQVSPVPPVASTYGTLHLKRASDSMDSILVTSRRRSYAAGDQINITITAGAAFSCTLRAEDSGTYRRTIEIVATATTTLSTVITALNALIPPAPDNANDDTPPVSWLVDAVLEGGASGTDVILSPQARQFVSGNFDGEAHSLTNANLAAFFATATNKLAEGDTLCVSYAMLTDTASTGGRRQSLPENSNTTITSGMLFNSRVNPEKLVNALPICKVVSGNLVFATGAVVTPGPAYRDLASIEQLRWDSTTPSGEGTLYVERPDQTYSVSSLPPALAPLGRLMQLGTQLLASAADARKARIAAPYSGTYAYTLLMESARASGSGPTLRAYVTSAGVHLFTVNAMYGGSSWAKDVNGTGAYMVQAAADGFTLAHRAADDDTTWTTWTQAAQFAGAREPAVGTADTYKPQLALYDVLGNRRTVFDHLGMPSGQRSELREDWLLTTVPSTWTSLSGVAPTVSAPSLQMPVRALTLSLNGAQAGVIAQAGYVGYFGAGTCLVTEFTVFTSGAVPSDNTNTYHDFGFQWAGNAGTDYILFRHKATHTDWRAVMITAGIPSPLTGTATGVNVALDTCYRMRIEVMNTVTLAWGGTKVARFFINGVLTNTIPFTTPAPNTFRFYFQGVNNTSPVTPTAWRLGPVSMCWNNFITDDAV